MRRPEPPRTLLDMNTALSSPPIEGEPLSVTHCRAAMESDQEGFRKEHAEQEARYRERLRRWEERKKEVEVQKQAPEKPPEKAPAGPTWEDIQRQKKEEREKELAEWLFKELDKINGVVRMKPRSGPPDPRCVVCIHHNRRCCDKCEDAVRQLERDHQRAAESQRRTPQTPSAAAKT